MNINKNKLIGVLEVGSKVSVEFGDDTNVTVLDGTIAVIPESWKLRDGYGQLEIQCSLFSMIIKLSDISNIHMNTEYVRIELDNPTTTTTPAT